MHTLHVCPLRLVGIGDQAVLRPGPTRAVNTALDHRLNAEYCGLTTGRLLPPNKMHGMHVRVATTVTPDYTTRSLDAETWDDFAQLVEANNGVWGGCWCMGFHPGVGKGRTAAQNRQAKREHVRNGTVHQILVYDGDQCVGWCQYGSHAELPNIKNPKAYEKGLAELPDWRIGCIFTDKHHRGEGVARAAVAGALDAIRKAGGGLVEAYPEQVEGRQPQRGAYFHTGPEDLFAEFGFERDRRVAKWRWVMRRRLQP